MTDWLAPSQLASTGVQVALSSIFGSYADKREVQAALTPEPLTGEQLYDQDYQKDFAGGDFWLDYCADMGDGFEPTYAMAWLMSRPHLVVDNERLLRGRALVLGGDQVYPTAKRDEYDNRFVGPFTAALPWVKDSNLEMFAIPGNHDWYDGLTSFLRLFCQKRWIGGRRTRQRRSYFALRLPNNWWIWGTDLQLGADVDEPQRQYFRNVAQQMRLDSGDKANLILCTAQPSWVFCDELDDNASEPPRNGCRHAVDSTAFASLDFLHREVIERNRIRLAAIVSGDLHHYTHYGEDTKNENQELHLVTSGGGGAYLYPTHHMPERLSISAKRKADGSKATEPRTFKREAAFPDVKVSRNLGRWGWVALPWRNRTFAPFVAGLYLLYAWMIQSASKRGTTLFNWFPGRPTSLMELLADVGLSEINDAVHAYWDVLRHSPANVVFGLVLVVGLFAYRRAEKRTRLWGLSGALHGGLHLLLCFGLIWAFSRLNLQVLNWGVDSIKQIALFTAEMLVAGGLLGGWLFGIYLVLASRLTGAHTNEVFSSQALTSYKNFLRMQFTPDGKLKIHAIGVPAIPKQKNYKYRGDDKDLQPGDSWFDPPGGTIDFTRFERIDIAATGGKTP